MSRKKAQPSFDLTSPENVQKGQAVYDRIVAGKCKDVTAELNDAYGRSGKSKRG